MAEATVANYHFDTAFIGVDGLTVQQGCTTHDEMEAHTDLAFIQQARRTIVVADSSKVGRVRFAMICGISSVTELVTDSDIDSAALAELRRAGVSVIIA